METPYCFPHRRLLLNREKEGSLEEADKRLNIQEDVGCLRDKALLGSLLFLATLVMACKAVCFLEPRKGLPEQPPGDCVDPDGTKHPLDSYWVKDCNRCFCGPDSISCCSLTSIPQGYDKEKCQQVFHPENCTYSVVEKTNPGKSCPVPAWVL